MYIAGLEAVAGCSGVEPFSPSNFDLIVKQVIEANPWGLAVGVYGEGAINPCDNAYSIPIGVYVSGCYQSVSSTDDRIMPCDGTGYCGYEYSVCFNLETQQFEVTRVGEALLNSEDPCGDPEVGPIPIIFGVEQGCQIICGQIAEG